MSETPRTPTQDEPTPLEGGTSTAEATPAGQPEPDAIPSVELPFRIEDVTDPQAQSYLRGREAQMRRGFEEAVRTTRQRERELAQRAAILDRIDDPESRRDALKEFLSAYEIDLDWEDTDGTQPAGFDSDEDDDFDPVQARLAALEAAQEEAEEAAQQASAQQQEQLRLAHVRQALDQFAAEEKFGATGDKIPAFHRDAIIEIALARGTDEETGLFDMEGAITEHRARVAALVASDRKGYVGSKDTPAVVVGGESADPRVDLTTQEGRLTLANRIAQRHVG